MKKITLDQMKNLPIEEITRLYQMGYRIDYDSKLSNLANDPIIDPFVNFGKATVSTGYDSSAQSIVLNTGNGSIFPNPSVSGPFNLVWWNSTDYGDPSDDPNKEIVRCTVRSADTLTIQRAQEGTSASIKNLAGKTYKVVLSITAKVFTDIQTDSQTRVNTGVSAHSSATSGIHGVVGNIVGTTDYQTLRNKTITDPTNYILASFLKSLTTTIDISLASAPLAGQVLTATSPTTAIWQSLAAPTCFFVSVSSSPSSGSAPLSVSFNATIIGGVAPYTYSWSFGDGGISTSPAPTHTYVSSGTYTAVLTLTDSTGSTTVAANTITVVTGIAVVATGLGMIESLGVPDTIGYYNSGPSFLESYVIVESAVMYNVGPLLEDSFSIIDSLAGIYNAGPPLSDSIPISTVESMAMLSSISIPSTASVSVGSYIILTPSCSLYGTSTTCPILYWTSSNTPKATVDSTGQVTGIAAGTATIIAYAGTSSTVVSNTCTVTVS